MSIAVVTREFSPLTRNGCIGTAPTTNEVGIFGQSEYRKAISGVVRYVNA